MQNSNTEGGKWTGPDFKFDDIAQNVFFPIYDVIAIDILTRTNSAAGNMIDIGCGGGHLGLALMKKTRHQGYFIDINETALKIAKRRAEEWGLHDRAFFIKQDVHKMDFPDGFADLIVSRGSYHFWEDIEKAFLEIYRVLSPNGKTYIGGGLGNSELTASIRAKMEKIKPDWHESIGKRIAGVPMDKLKRLFQKHSISYEIIENEEQGRWIILHKGTNDR
ncbi:MAG: class I SAM-dependent methyltransferase [Dehalococcoidales bacterium]|jgi:ubiquinone/menaquinone biosynthesis C-methylase UbiE